MPQKSIFFCLIEAIDIEKKSQRWYTTSVLHINDFDGESNVSTKQKPTAKHSFTCLVNLIGMLGNHCNFPFVPE